MTAVRVSPATLVNDTISAFDKINGRHAGFRPAHAKGILLAGAFTPSAAAKTLARAPHFERPSTPVSVRFSNFAGVPNIADNHRDAGPRGMAVRFHLGPHVHTDIIAHSTDGFPARTAQEFLEFLRAAGESGPDQPHPNPIEQFLGSHPAALQFLQTPKPVPASFASENFFSVSAYRFTNWAGTSQFGRYRLIPAGGTQYLDDTTAAQMGPNFLFEDIVARLEAGGVAFHIVVQLAGEGDVIDDATVRWPESRMLLNLGTLELKSTVPENEAEQRHVIFDPIPRVDGIDASKDPLLQPRADVYLVSGRRRRADGPRVDSHLGE